MSKKTTSVFLLLLTALIWGSAFVAQSKGMEHVGPFTYNGIRSLIGGAVLIPVLLVFRALRRRSGEGEQASSRKRATVIGGLCCGLALFAASSLQQFGISMTTAGKAGFITALYIVIVPILGLFIGRRVPVLIWLCVAAAIAGFYLLCVKEGFSVGTGDMLVLGCAFIFSVHIILIDRFNAMGADGMMLSCIQLLTAGAISLPLMFIFEEPSLGAVLDARISILYAGVLSCGVAYTLQIIGQKHADPTAATLILSLESVFAALSGWLILDERLSGRELGGCALVLAAVIAAQMIAGRSDKKSG